MLARIVRELMFTNTVLLRSTQSLPTPALFCAHAREKHSVAYVALYVVVFLVNYILFRSYVTTCLKGMSCSNGHVVFGISFASPEILA